VCVCVCVCVQPTGQCWKWKPRPTVGLSGSLLEIVDLEEMEHNNETAPLEQFMVSTRFCISMGGNLDVSCGLQLNDESSPAVGFANARYWMWQRL
jgi:hypothetical protein